MARLAGEHFGERDALVLGLVGEHRPAHDVADRVDARHVGGEMLVDDDLPALHRDAERLEAEALRVGAPADRDQHDVGLERLRLAAGGGLDRRLDARRAFFSTLRDLVAEMELEALLLQHALELLGDLAVHAGQDAVEELDHRHLGAEPPPDRAELEADDAGADDDELLRRLGERERAGRGDDGLLVDLDAGQARDVGAGGDDDRLGLEGRLVAVGALDDDLAGRARCGPRRRPSRSCSS